MKKKADKNRDGEFSTTQLHMRKIMVIQIPGGKKRKKNAKSTPKGNTLINENGNPTNGRGAHASFVYSPAFHAQSPSVLSSPMNGSRLSSPGSVDDVSFN